MAQLMDEQKQDACGVHLSDSGPMPAETLDYWIEAYLSDASGIDFCGHGMLVQAAREYRVLRAIAGRAVSAWSSTALPCAHGEMMQESMEALRAWLEPNQATECAIGQ